MGNLKVKSLLNMRHLLNIRHAMAFALFYGLLILASGCRQSSVLFGGGWDHLSNETSMRISDKKTRLQIPIPKTVCLYLDAVSVDSLGNGLYRYACNKTGRKQKNVLPLLCLSNHLMFSRMFFKMKYRAFLAKYPHLLSVNDLKSIADWVERPRKEYGKVWMFD